MVTILLFSYKISIPCLIRNSSKISINFTSTILSSKSTMSPPAKITFPLSLCGGMLIRMVFWINYFILRGISLSCFTFRCKSTTAINRSSKNLPLFKNCCRTSWFKVCFDPLKITACS